ncbi:MAG: hypothetical protein ABIP82_05195 [Nitrospirales bacterium]
MKKWSTIRQSGIYKHRHTRRLGVTVMFWIAGVRPGSRATFVSAKVAKTK